MQIARIGEAANYLCKPEYGDYQNSRPEIPWKEIKGMRTILVHMYWGIDDEIGWTAVEKLPPLKEAVKAWIKEREPERTKELPQTKASNKLKEMLRRKKDATKEQDKEDDSTR